VTAADTAPDTAALCDPGLFTTGGHHALFDQLRAAGGVHWTPETDGAGFWSVVSHRHVKEANRDDQTYSSAVQGVNIPDLDVHAGAGADMARQMMVLMDPPRHTRYRLLVNRGFTPRVIARMETHLAAKARAIVDHVVDTTGADGTGRCEVVGDVAAQLPLTAIAELVGVPDADRHRIFEWSNALVGSDDPEFGARDGTMEASAEMYTYALELREQRRAEPADDIVSDLLGAEVDGHTLTDGEFAMFFLLLCVAGNETTRNATTHGVAAFMAHPDQWERLRTEPDLMPSAVEEILRWSSPIHHFRRTATVDTTLDGQPIAEGDKVVLWYASANRDPAVFAEPHRFDIARSPNDHVTFGAGGPHYCLGANLARLELRLIFSELVERIAEVHPDGAAEMLRSNFVHGIKRLPVTYAVAGIRSTRHRRPLRGRFAESSLADALAAEREADRQRES
jgi:cholest-4-en-3-one 26-monooxygenase